MLTMQSASRAFGWGTTYELQLFRDGHWVISSVFDDRREALQEAHRLDRTGRMVRLRADEVSAAGQSRGMRTVFLSSTIKKTWHAERERIIQRGIRPLRRSAKVDDEAAHRVNPYFLLFIFSLVAFGGLGAIFALRMLYAAI
jgi:hypothetical protein